MSGEWPELPIGEVATVNPRRDGALRLLDDQLDATFVPMAAVDEISGTIANPKIKALGELRKGFTPFVEDDVIFAKITPCMQNGKSAVARGLANGLGFGSTEFHVIRCGPRVIPEWIWYFLRQQSVKEEAQRRFRGSAGQQRVPADFLKQLRMPVPSRDQQRRLVYRIDQCMERIDEIRSLGDQLVLESNALLPSLLEAAFTELKTTYSSRTIGACLVESRYGTSRRCDASPTATPVLRIPNVAQGTISCNDIKYCELAGKELERLRLKTGDILVVRTNGSRELVGRCAVYVEGDRPFAFASYLIRLRVAPCLIDPHYLFFFLASTMGRDAIARIRRTSAGQYNVNSENLRGIELPLPPLPIQKKVTERLIEQRDAVTAMAGNQIANSDDSDLLANAVLRKAFSGEL